MAFGFTRNNKCLRPVSIDGCRGSLQFPIRAQAQGKMEALLLSIQMAPHGLQESAANSGNAFGGSFLYPSASHCLPRVQPSHTWSSVGVSRGKVSHLPTATSSKTSGFCHSLACSVTLGKISNLSGPQLLPHLK